MQVQQEVVTKNINARMILSIFWDPYGQIAELTL